MSIARGVVCFLVSVSLAACNAVIAPVTPAVPTSSPSPEVTTDPTPAEWIEQEVSGVVLGVEKPKGWHAQQTEDGILLVEYSTPMANGRNMRGVQVHIFVHSTRGFEIATGKNAAWSILEQIVRDRQYIGSARANEPYGFKWSGHDAAFYLSNNGDGNMTMVLAVVLPDAEHMVVCNVTSPASEAKRIRSILPVVFESLTVNGVQMGSAALGELPDPLVFPADVPRERP